MEMMTIRVWVEGKENDGEQVSERMVRRMCRMMLRRMSFWGLKLIKHTLCFIGQVVQCVRLARLLRLASMLNLVFSVSCVC